MLSDKGLFGEALQSTSSSQGGRGERAAFREGNAAGAGEGGVGKVAPPTLTLVSTAARHVVARAGRATRADVTPRVRVTPDGAPTTA